MEERNQRPEEGSKLPGIALGVLIFIIFALLYVGYEYFTDQTSSTSELTNVKMDTTMMASRKSEEAVQSIDSQPIQDEKSAKYAPPASAPDEVVTAEDGADEDRKPTPPVAATPKVEAPKPVKPKPAPAEEPEKKEVLKKAETIPAVVRAGGASVTHTVATGQTFYGIASRYNIKLETLRKLNPTVEDKNIKVGVTKIKIPVRAVHTVGPGDILRVVAQKYGVTVQQLMAANGKTKNVAARGEKLVIPYPEKN